MKLKSIPRQGRLPSLRDGVMIDSVRGVLRVRKWPRKRGRPKSELQRWWNDWFTQANYLAKYADPMSQARAIEMTKGTGLYPRDVLLSAMRGRLYTWADETGWKWFPVAAIQDVSDSLDMLGQTVGDILVRAVDRWRVPTPGNVDDVLTLKGSPAIPTWAVPGGGGLAFGGALVTSLSNQAILNAVFTPVTFTSEAYDTDAIHDNAVNPTRLTVPAGWGRVRLTGGLRWNSSNTGVRIVLFWLNGAKFPGDSMCRYLPRSNSEHSIASPPIPVVEGDYFEIIARTDGAGTRNVEGPQASTYFAMERVS